MTKGTIIGARSFSGISKKTQNPFSGFELCVRRAPGYANKDFVGEHIDTFMAFDQALGDYSPKPGDGVSYHLYRQGNSVQCGFVMHDPDFDE